ncbi:hypothetical protein BU17DRAFT_88474 [Hysterangium stoloniferum]|nr:hypothetical protein BU17DRAFT_88474 [Hysterangium stoloniferum]
MFLKLIAMGLKAFAYDVGAIAHVALLLIGICYGVGLAMEYPVISGLIQYTVNIAVHIFEIALLDLGKFGSYLRSLSGPLSMKASGVVSNKFIVFLKPHNRLEALRLLYSIATRLLEPSPAPAHAPQITWASRSLALFKVVTGAKIDRHYAGLIISWLPVGASSHLELRTCYRQSLPPVQYSLSQTMSVIPAMLFRIPITADVMDQAVRILYGVEEYIDAEICPKVTSRIASTATCIMAVLTLLVLELACSPVRTGCRRVCGALTGLLLYAIHWLLEALPTIRRLIHRISAYSFDSPSATIPPPIAAPPAPAVGVVNEEAEVADDANEDEDNDDVFVYPANDADEDEDNDDVFVYPANDADEDKDDDDVFVYPANDADEDEDDNDVFVYPANDADEDEDDNDVFVYPANDADEDEDDNVFIYPMSGTTKREAENGQEIPPSRSPTEGSSKPYQDKADLVAVPPEPVPAQMVINGEANVAKDADEDDDDDDVFVYPMSGTTKREAANGQEIPPSQGNSKPYQDKTDLVAVPPEPAPAQTVINEEAKVTNDADEDEDNDVFIYPMSGTTKREAENGQEIPPSQGSSKPYQDKADLVAVPPEPVPAQMVINGEANVAKDADEDDDDDDDVFVYPMSGTTKREAANGQEIPPSQGNSKPYQDKTDLVAVPPEPAPAQTVINEEAKVTNDADEDEDDDVFIYPMSGTTKREAENGQEIPPSRSPTEGNSKPYQDEADLVAVPPEPAPAQTIVNEEANVTNDADEDEDGDEDDVFVYCPMSVASPPAPAPAQTVVNKEAKVADDADDEVLEFDDCALSRTAPPVAALPPMAATPPVAPPPVAAAAISMARHHLGLDSRGGPRTRRVEVNTAARASGGRETMGDERQRGTRGSGGREAAGDERQ